MIAGTTKMRLVSAKNNRYDLELLMGTVGMDRKGIWSWTDLRAIGNSRAVQVSVLFPLVGYLILFNDQLSGLFATGKLDSAPPFVGLIAWLWAKKLYFLYFGLMSLGLGSLIYSRWCPHIVKKHGDFADYVRFDGPAISYDGVLQLANILGDELARQAAMGATPSVGEVERRKPDILRRWYAQQSNTGHWVRNCTSALFVLGLGLLAVPSTISAIKIAALLAR